ncbi:photosystem II stability/assembly factor-like protein [Nitrogeniibacter mangrovi]|uniref:Photosystem II stability/assembly factor-like protein n=1 Tax=Nitrogeniibacter mangrovi TaxID=2016596 RepID=A0A6C1B4D7_9RHOO|nr:photosystem II stability/assembly factor-like protein [Nitrogeniibacter mangrovi]QID18357.1 photosystem II stability/assembly factor-like protein [Nitrogeniibacter mangrovi]
MITPLIPKSLAPWIRALGSCFIVASAHAGDVPHVVSSGTPHDMLYAVSLEDSHGIAVGDAGLVMVSNDGGSTWSRQGARPTDLALLSVARKSGRCLAGGQSGLILVAPDCTAWHKADSGTEERIFSVDMNRKHLAYAAGAFGTLLRSEDGGKAWTSIEIPWDQVLGDIAEPHLYAVKVLDSGDALVAGEFGLMLRIDPQGQWTVLHKGKRSLFNLVTTADGVIFAVGQEGVILKSEDRGTHWRELESGTAAILTSVWADDRRDIVVGGVNTLLSSRDGGATWHMPPSALVRRNWQLDLAASEGAGERPRIISVGSGGKVMTFTP